ncbi:MAG: hypothetical protein LBJ62_10975 [Bifidobacteriaceae bacterium]|nr:hypothetical protein [Bifidobacteriaceae bacterium]
MRNDGPHVALADARATAEDLEITDDEHQELAEVATLLGFTQDRVRSALRDALSDASAPGAEGSSSLIASGAEQAPRLAEHQAAAPAKESSASPIARFSLSRGDIVTFTGQSMAVKERLEAAATAAGLVPHPRVIKQVKLLVADDPDTLSGKGKKAAEYVISIMKTAAFERPLSQMSAKSQVNGTPKP